MEPLAAAVMMCVPMSSGPIPEPVAVIDAFVQAYNDHDIPTLRQLVAEDADMGTPQTPTSGRDVVDAYETVVFRRWPKIHLVIDERIVSSDLVAQTETIGAPGEQTFSGLSLYRVDRGCITQMSISK